MRAGTTTTEQRLSYVSLSPTHLTFQFDNFGLSEGFMQGMPASQVAATLRAMADRIERNAPDAERTRADGIARQQERSAYLQTLSPSQLHQELSRPPRVSHVDIGY